MLAELVMTVSLAMVVGVKWVLLVWGRLREDLDGAGEARPERLLQRHVQVADGLELVGARERPGVDRPQAAVLDDLADDGLGVRVVGGEQDVERLARDLALDERPGEGRVERLDDLRAGRLARDLLGGRAGVEGRAA